MLFTLGIGSLVLAAVCSFAVYSSRNFATFLISSDLDQKNRQTLDQMVKDFRMIGSVTNFNSNSITCLNFGGSNTMTYTYDPAKDTLTRVSGGSSAVLLTNCVRLNFSMLQRNMTNATFDFFPTTNVFECKAITVDWCCQRKLLGTAKDDLPQTATIVIRN